MRDPQTSSAATAGSSIIDDVSTVRTATQWLVAAAGAVGTVLVAGLQIGAMGRLVDNPWLLAGASVAYLAALTAQPRPSGDWRTALH
jgi:hypothetical protein